MSKRSRKESDGGRGAGSGAAGGAGGGAMSPQARARSASHDELERVVALDLESKVVPASDDGFLWVLAVDASRRSEDAYAWLAKVLAPKRDALHIVCAVEVTAEPSEEAEAAMDPEELFALRRKIKSNPSNLEHAEAVLKRYAANATRDGVSAVRGAMAARQRQA